MTSARVILVLRDAGSSPNAVLETAQFTASQLRGNFEQVMAYLLLNVRTNGSPVNQYSAA